MNYLTPKTRREVLEYLVTGLKRLEYRGYDSAGIAIDTDDSKGILLIKQTGKVKVLEDAIAEQTLGHDIDTPLTQHCGEFGTEFFLSDFSDAKTRNLSFQAFRTPVGQLTDLQVKEIRIRSDLILTTLLL